MCGREQLVAQSVGFMEIVASELSLLVLWNRNCNGEIMDYPGRRVGMCKLS